MSEEVKEALNTEEFTPYMSYQVRMASQAGYAQYKEWPNGGETVHAGVGWFHPFGKSEYYAVAGDCKEKEAFPEEKFFTKDWQDTFDTHLFCIYRLPDGDIYAYDGIFCVRGGDSDVTIPLGTDYIRRDILTNVIVGGTGRYEGARGLMLGTAEGSGETKDIDGDGFILPEGLLKCLDGYIKIPVKE